MAVDALQFTLSSTSSFPSISLYSALLIFIVRLSINSHSTRVPTLHTSLMRSLLSKSHICIIVILHMVNTIMCTTDLESSYWQSKYIIFVSSFILSTSTIQSSHILLSKPFSRKRWRDTWLPLSKPFNRKRC